VHSVRILSLGGSAMVTATLAREAKRHLARGSIVVHGDLASSKSFSAAIDIAGAMDDEEPELAGSLQIVAPDGTTRAWAALGELRGAGFHCCIFFFFFFFCFHCSHRIN
jgi:hypothetical protein